MKKLSLVTLLIVLAASGFSQEISIETGLLGAVISGNTGNMTYLEFAPQYHKDRDMTLATATDDPRPGAYLGIALVLNGEEVDQPAVIVRGRFQKKIAWNQDILMKSGGSITVIARLWGVKITSEACRVIHGSPCEWCRRNGYHLENDEAYAREVFSPF